MKITKNTKPAPALNGASEELNRLLPGFKVTSSEMRRTLGRGAKLYIRLDEILPTTQLIVK